MARFLIEHTGENRRTRRAATANWVPPSETAVSASSAVVTVKDGVENVTGVDFSPRMPTRRELWKQRQRNRRGKLDLELRGLQAARLASRPLASTTMAEERVLSRMADTWAQNPEAFELELARRYPADLAQKIALECQRRKANT